MKVMIFTEGTIVMHRNGSGHTREEIVRQVEDNEESVHDYGTYVPIGDAVRKIRKWKCSGAEILYLTSRRKPEEVRQIKDVIRRYNFPSGLLLFRREGEEYKDVAERVLPDVLIEDDCESIGGFDEMTITHVKPEIRKDIKSVPVKEFGGIDHLPDNVSNLL